MADSTLSITVRDPEHPCAPYQRTGHSFFVQIWHCDGRRYSGAEPTMASSRASLSIPLV